MDSTIIAKPRAEARVTLPSIVPPEPRMLEKLGRIRLLYIVLGVLLLVGLLPLAFTGYLLSGRSADELRSVEGRY
ncbi:MAG TPA: hypothetical protein VFT26_09745, partial [Pyrinomonadaceae bacterium]|nr:hypothetical protein [Pyrinomonadaceae bacterium]